MAFFLLGSIFDNSFSKLRFYIILSLISFLWLTVFSQPNSTNILSLNYSLRQGEINMFEIGMICLIDYLIIYKLKINERIV